ncbi:cyclin-Q-like [Mya arenaria]|uniref:cyclin-Q-like n=1 Tax=Mya arenaria TaxID=6604 RepID=UPI0022DF747A|nr:cyclin-Q-like [Mya arenaria]
MGDNEGLVHFRVVRFIYEAGMKLRMKTIPLSTTCVLYHRFFRENKLDDFDPYLIAATCLYLAGKVEEEQHISLRDVVNVTYRTLNRDKPPLEMGEKYWQYRDSVVNCELFLLRSLQFKSVVYHPHKFLLHYLKYLEDWFDPVTWSTFPLTRTCWGILRDTYHSPLALRYKPQHIAIAVLYFSILCHGLEVPHNRTADRPWWKVFKEDITLNEIKDIINEIIFTFDMEAMLQTSG